jgi:hypothetical protein
MSEFPQIRASNDGVAKVIGAAKEVVGAFSKNFGQEAKEKQRSSANLSYAQSAEANVAATSKLLKVSAKLDRKQTRTEGSEARKTQKSARKNINKLEARANTKVSAGTDGKGGFQASYTKAAAPKTSSTKPKVAKGANPARRGAK